MSDDTRKIIEGMALLEAVMRLRKLEHDTTDPQEKRGIVKAADVVTNLGTELLTGEDK